MKKNIVIIFVLSILMLTTIQIVNNNNIVSATVTGYSEYNGQNGFLYIYPTATWTLARNPTSASSILQTYIYGRSLYNGNYGNYRGFCFFDTSSIPDTATISKVNLSVTISYVTNDPGLIILSDNATAHRPGISLALDDYDISFYETKNYQSTTLTTGSKNITLSNTTWLINKTGITRFCLTNNKCDGLNVAPTVNSVLIQIDEEESMKLWITYTVPVANAPRYFDSMTQNATWIKLNWTNGLLFDKTVIIGKIGSFPTLGVDSVLYNGTGNFFNHTGLINNSNWFYKCYSFNSIGGFNQTYLKSHDTTEGIPILNIHQNNTNSTSSYTKKYKSYNTIYSETRQETYISNTLPTLSKDADWTTTNSLSDSTWYFIVYEKPVSFYAQSIKWMIKDACDYWNFTISETMYNYNESYLVFAMYYEPEDSTTYYYSCSKVNLEGFFSPSTLLGYADYGCVDIYEELLLLNSSIPGYEGYYINFTATGNLTPIHHYTNIVNAYGSETFKQNNTGYWLWNNWTGLRLYLYKNFFNVSGDLTNKTNATGYIVYGNATGNATIFDENEYILPIFTTISLMGVGFLMIRRRKKNEP